MDQPRRSFAVYGALWTALVIALCAAIAVWGVQIDATFRAAAPVASKPTGTPAPLLFTVYSDLGPPNPATLCASVPPSVRVVTVETSTGVVLSRRDCPAS